MDGETINLSKQLEVNREILRFLSLKEGCSFNIVIFCLNGMVITLRITGPCYRGVWMCV